MSRFGVGLSSQLLHARYSATALARADVWTARASGIDSWWAADHLNALYPRAIVTPSYLGVARLVPKIDAQLEPWSMLGYVAARSRFGRLRLGVGVTDASRRHPAVTAQAAATLNLIAHGRFILGMGVGMRGGNEPYGVDWTTPVARFEEAIATIRALWSSHGQLISRDSPYFPLRDAVFDLPGYRGRWPEIWIAARGPRMLAITGRHADAWFPGMLSHPADYASGVDAVKAAASDAGRNPDAIIPALSIPVASGHSRDDIEEALSSAAAQALALGLAGQTWTDRGIQHPFGDGFSGAQDLVPQTLDEQAVLSATKSVPTTLLRDAVLAGTPDEVIDQAAEWRDHGVRYLVVNNVSVLQPSLRKGIASSALPDDLATAYEQVRSSPLGSGRLPNPANKPGMAAPTRAATAAVGVTIALSILGAPDTATAGAALRWIVHRARRSGVAMNTTTAPEWGRGASTTLTAVQLNALAPFMKPSDQLRNRTATAIPSNPPQGDSNAERLTHQLPTMFWPAWSLRFTVPPCSPLQMRPALSAAMMLVGTKLNLTAAAHRTGSAVTAAGVSRSLHFLSNDPGWADSLFALARLGDYLSRNAVPIDYARRRHLDYRGLLPGGLWSEICQATLITPGAGFKADLIRSVLFERLSGLPAIRSPFAVNSNEFRSKAAAFPRFLTPDFAARLDETCRQFLDDHDLTEEPATWHPPLDLLSGLDLPGGDPSNIDITELHRLVRAENLAFTDIADQLGATIDAVRHILEFDPAPVQLTPSQRRSRGIPFAAVKMQLPKATLVDLYQRQRLSLDQIAHRVGSNERSIARLIRMYEIPLRTRADRTRVAIDPDWLREQYVTQGRTLTDIGREVGLSVSRMGRRAKAHNITTRPPGGSTTGHRTLELARVAAGFPILRPALIDTASWVRLQRFAAGADHNSLRTAARALGTHSGRLCKQIDRLEHDLGGRLLVRTPTRYQRMQLTSLGTEVRATVRDALDVSIGELLKDVSAS